MGKIVVFKGSPSKNRYSTKLVEQVISGALLFTTGGSSVNPTPGMGNVGIANIWYDMYTKKDRTEEYVTEDKIDQIN